MTPNRSTEHDELLTTLALHRQFLTTTANGLTGDQARATPTASSLSIGGIIDHVAATEAEWTAFILEGAPGYDRDADHGPESLTMTKDQTLADVLANYATTAEETERVINTIDDLNTSQLLPEAPWFPPGATWSARRVLLHLIAETAQHAGHADIIRETIDGQKTMG